INISRQFTDGVDFNLRYNLQPTRAGLFTLTADGTWTNRFLRQARPEAPVLDSVGILPFFSSANSPPIEWRSKGTLAWTADAWGASLTAAYVGSFESNTTTPSARNPTGTGYDGHRIDDSLTFDAQVSYEAGRGSSKWLAGTRWTLGVQNLFDTAPAFWSDGVRGY